MTTFYPDGSSDGIIHYYCNLSNYYNRSQIYSHNVTTIYIENEHNFYSNIYVCLNINYSKD